MSNSESQLINTKIQESEYSQNQNIQSYSHSQYHQPRKEKHKTKQLVDIVQGKWSEQQKLKYILFVYHHLKTFQSKTKRKNLRVFKTLSQYLGSRTPRQCRSHFQKLMNRFKNIKKMIEFYQNQIGMMQFLQAHKMQTILIQTYPVQSQTIEKISVLSLEKGCQTEFPDITQQFQQSKRRIKVLQQMLFQANYLRPQVSRFFFPSANCFNLSQFRGQIQ